MNPLRKNQQGAVLIVALVMLLVITLLAVTSTRESSLETRMTANFVFQQQQLNYSEAVLREGEERMTFAAVCAPVPNAGGTCEADDVRCLYADAAKYGHDFGSCSSDGTHGLESSLLASSAYDGDIAEPARLRWYSIPAPAGEQEGQSDNPEYGNRMMGLGVFRYEINGRARDDGTDTCTVLRSTTAKYFDIPRAQCQ